MTLQNQNFYSMKNIIYHQLVRTIIFLSSGSLFLKTYTKYDFEMYVLCNDLWLISVIIWLIWRISWVKQNLFSSFVDLQLQLHYSYFIFSRYCWCNISSLKSFFPGAISLDSTGNLLLQGSVGNMIKEPFDITWLAFGNLEFSVGINIFTGLPTISEFTFSWRKLSFYFT